MEYGDPMLYAVGAMDRLTKFWGTLTKLPKALVWTVKVGQLLT